MSEYLRTECKIHCSFHFSHRMLETTSTVNTVNCFKDCAPPPFPLYPPPKGKYEINLNFITPVLLNISLCVSYTVNLCYLEH